MSAGSILLLNPPYADFTSPYHSLSYVAPPLMAAGYDVDILDLNAVWFRHVFDTRQIAVWAAAIREEIAGLDALPVLDLDQQARLVDLMRALSLTAGLEPDETIATFRSERFYDWSAYQDAREQICQFEKLLDFVHAPMAFSTAFSLPPHEPDAGALVSKSKLCRTFIAEIEQLLRQRFGGKDYLFCGVTIPYSANLLPGMAVLRALDRVFPGVPRVAGGTALSDIYKYRRSPKTLFAFSEVCDYFYIGEAEPGICRFAAHLKDASVSLPTHAVNLHNESAPLTEKLDYISLSPIREAPRFTPYDWRASPPYYEWIDWSLYLAPERRVLYAPCRGCFWNQCTFCDYGLNEDGPTAPSRTMQPEVVAEHLEGLTRLGIHRVYFAADAVAPNFLSGLADELLKAEWKMSWTCQLFLTKNFNPELVGRLERSGLLIASFGLESGSSRVLESMGKGRNRVEGVLQGTMAAFSASRVGLQPLFFFGFPGETNEDRQMTIDFLRQHEQVFSPVSRGGVFTLLPGSMIARDPGRYGLTDLRDRPEDDIVSELDYHCIDGSPPAVTQDFSAFNDQLSYRIEFERPWVGGIDTLHSHLYVERYGREVFSRLREEAQQRDMKSVAADDRSLEIESCFDLDEIAQNVLIHRALTANGANACGLYPAAGEYADAAAEILVPMHRGIQLRRFRMHAGAMADV